jgi:hypothetical protein
MIPLLRQVAAYEISVPVAEGVASDSYHRKVRVAE